MTSKHTPGPWTLDANDFGWFLISANGQDVLTEAFDTEEANARLIAAAPAMLAALRFYAGWGIAGPTHDERVNEDCGDMARALIAQIEGNSDAA